MRIGNQCTLSTFRTTGRKIWGVNICKLHREFFIRTQQVALALEQKAQRFGFANDFNQRTFFAAARMALVAHVELDGSPGLRKSGEPYAFHMLRILERLAEEDVPYLGWRAYSATWLHDTLEDTALSFTEIEKVFGSRVANIVDTLSNFKVSKHQSKLEQAEIYDPRFAEEIRDFPEALYIKLADVDDYFNTCKGMKEDSIFFHFRFINEVLYPLGIPVFGAQKLALKVANKALRVQNIVAWRRNLRPIERLTDVKLFANVTQQLSAQIRQAGIEASVEIVIRSPYELFLKERKAEEGARRERHFLQRSLGDAEFLLYADREDEIGRYRDINQKPKPKLNIRDIVFYNIIASDEQTCQRIKELLCQIFPAISERSRDFIKHPKPNGYKALHEELTIGDENYRVRIFTPAMEKVNRLGLGYKLLSAQGMGVVDSVLLSEPILPMIKETDRQGRRQILGRFSDVRQVNLNVKNPLPKTPQSLELPVWRQDTLLDVLALAHPLLALKFSSARWHNIGWGTNNKLDPREAFDWYTGQSLQIRLLQQGWTGYDLHTFLQNPLARKDVKIFIADELSTVSQVGIGRSMVRRALRMPRYQIPGLTQANFKNVLENKTDYLEEEVYQSLAIGEMSIFHIMQTLYVALERD